MNVITTVVASAADLAAGLTGVVTCKGGAAGDACLVVAAIASVASLPGLLALPTLSHSLMLSSCIKHLWCIYPNGYTALDKPVEYPALSMCAMTTSCES